MNYILIKGNNGSVPGSGYYSFQLEIKENGQSQLTIKRGREEEEKTIVAETKTVSPAKVSELFNMANSLTTDTDEFAMVGGPEKIIEIKKNERKNIFIIKDENQPANHFFMECLQLFDAGLKQRLDEIIYF